MKRFVLCILLALLTLISSVAFAENANCCACCSGAKSAAEDDTTPTAYVPKYTDYTLEVVYHDFHLFLPPSFKNNSDETFLPDDGNNYPKIIVRSNDDIESDPLAFYPSQDELRAYYDTLVMENPEITIIQFDECIGLMRLFMFNDDYYVELTSTNRKNLLTVTLVSDSLDEALELAQGIIDHAVAKEIPLEELEQAE